MTKDSKLAFIFIFLTVLIDIMGYGIIIPVLPKLIQELTGATISEASSFGGWLIFAYSLPLFLFSPLLGSLSDRFGRRPILLFSLLGLGLDSILQALAPSIAWLFLGRFLGGITGASYSTAHSYIADITPPEKRAERFGIIGASFGFGFILGPLLGGILAPYGSRIPFFVAAGLAIANFIMGYFVLPESLGTEHRRRFRWKEANPIGSLVLLKRYKGILGLIIAIFLLNIAHHGVRTTWPYFTMEKFKWNETMVGYSLATVGLLYAIVQGGLMGIIIKTLGQKYTIFIGFILYFLGNLLFSIANEGWMVFVILVPYCMGGMEEPALQGVISSHIPPSEQGALQGMILSLVSITSIIGPPIMTETFRFFTKPGNYYFPGSPLLLGAILISISFFITFYSMNQEKSENKNPS